MQQIHTYSTNATVSFTNICGLIEECEKIIIKKITKKQILTVMP